MVITVFDEKQFLTLAVLNLTVAKVDSIGFVAGGVEPQAPATITDKNHVITDADNIGKGGEAAKRSLIF